MLGTKYTSYEMQINKGDKIFLYTDGVPEATDAEENMFGAQRMLDALNSNPDADPETLLKNVKDAVSGFVKDVKRLLAEADVGIIASEYEGFGLVTVEYMLAGLPVIGRRSGATPEIVSDGESGILYDDINGLADAMNRLMDDKKLAGEMGVKGEKRAKALFTDTDNLTQIMQVYKNGNKEKD